MAENKPTRDDLVAAIGARRELGPEYEDAVLDSFLARLENQIEARVDARVSQRLGQSPAASAESQSGRSDPGLVLGVWSVIAGIPVTAIATGNEGVVGLVVAWAGIATVNLAHALRRRRD